MLNGIPTQERMPELAGTQCGCHECIGPDRVHLYFQCPILQPLLTSVANQFHGVWVLPSPLQQQHIWLAIKPHPQLHQRIWDIVVVYLIYAFDKARRNWTDRVLKLQRGQSAPTRSSRTSGSRTRTLGIGHLLRPALR